MANAKQSGLIQKWHNATDLHNQRHALTVGGQLAHLGKVPPTSLSQSMPIQNVFWHALIEVRFPSNLRCIWCQEQMSISGSCRWACASRRRIRLVGDEQALCQFQLRTPVSQSRPVGLDHDGWKIAYKKIPWVPLFCVARTCLRTL